MGVQYPTLLHTEQNLVVKVPQMTQFVVIFSRHFKSRYVVWVVEELLKPVDIFSSHMVHAYCQYVLNSEIKARLSMYRGKKTSYRCYPIYLCATLCLLTTGNAGKGLFIFLVIFGI